MICSAEGVAAAVNPLKDFGAAGSRLSVDHPEVVQNYSQRHDIADPTCPRRGRDEEMRVRWSIIGRCSRISSDEPDCTARSSYSNLRQEHGKRLTFRFRITSGFRNGRDGSIPTIAPI